MRINVTFKIWLLLLLCLPSLSSGANAEETLDAKIDKALSKFIETYKGKCVEGNCQNGEGKVIYPDGSNYTGSFQDNMRNGYGIYIYKKGSFHGGNYKYVGGFENDLYQGKGTFISLDDKSSYTGDYVKGIREGKGIWVTSEGRYEGEWKGGLFNGKGVFYYPNGDIYDGLWVDGHKQKNK